MTELHIDIETYSETPLDKCGTYKYVEDPAFEVLLFGFAYDDDPVTVVDLAQGGRGAMPIPVWKDLLHPGLTKTAFNANFERVALSRWFKQRMPPELWRCTMVHASALGLPRSLDKVAKVLGLAEDEQKAKTGGALITFFSKPCAPTKRNNGRRRNLPHHDPARWELFKEYNAQDVVAERAVGKRLAEFPLPHDEQRIWFVDQHINDRGVLTDGVLVEQAIRMSDAIIERRTVEAVALTGLQNPNSVAQLKTWLAEEKDIEVTSLNKKTLPALLEKTDSDTVKRVLAIRGELGKASVKKYQAIQRAANSDQRLRGTLAFYAAHTGRWGGRIFQPQNLVQNHLEDLALARETVRAGDAETIDMLWGDTQDTLAQLVRTALIPAPGHRFIVADFSAVEARALAWQAGEKWRMDVFNTHGKIYEASAAQMFHVPIESIAKGRENYGYRQKGKVAELALGYGGAAGALKAMGALEKRYGLTEEELPPLVAAWRRASPAITRYWWDVGDAAVEAVQTGQPQMSHGLRFRTKGGFLFIRLPSGRELAYARPVVRPGRRGHPQLYYEGVDPYTKAWTKLDTYGPRLTENIIQAICRDLLAHGILNITGAGHKVCFHVHDEVIVESETATLEEIVQLMTDKPKWAEGMPLTADGFECEFYQKG